MQSLLYFIITRLNSHMFCSIRIYNIHLSYSIAQKTKVLVECLGRPNIKSKLLIEPID